MKTFNQLVDLHGKSALVTGAGGGLGTAVSEALAELGCNLILLDREANKVDRLAQELSEKHSVQVSKLVVDLEDEGQRNTIASFVNKNRMRLDVLINNAAFVGDSNLEGWVVPFEEQGIATWRRAIEVNLTAAFHLSQQLVPMMRESGGGSIVNVGSIYGVVGPDLSLYTGTQMGNPAAYAASKGGIIQLTRWMATVLAPDIRVNCVSPGGIYRNQCQTFVDRYEEKTPMGRMATEKDVVGPIIFFASALSRYVTGQNLLADGGWTVW